MGVTCWQNLLFLRGKKSTLFSLLTFKKLYYRLKKSDDQTNIDKYRTSLETLLGSGID